jgi:hypothetical protein
VKTYDWRRPPYREKIPKEKLAHETAKVLDRYIEVRFFPPAHSEYILILS